MRNGKNVFTIESAQEEAEQIEANTKTFRLVFFLISIISLLVAGIVIINIMFATIQERTREIGIRLAVGARRFDIFIQFLVQTLIVTFLGGLLGVAVGFSLLNIVSKYLEFQLIAYPGMVFAALAVSVGVGFVSGIIPAIKAANLDPVTALRYAQDRVLNQSASLTFITLLGFIPFLIFLFFLIPELPFASGESLENFLISVFVPTSAQQIGDYITQITTQKIPFNLFSFLLLIFTILGATSQKDKKFFGRLLYFLGMCLGGVMLLIILLSSSSVPFLIKFIRAPFLQSIITYFSPFLIIFVVFSLGFFFIPSVKIRNISVLIGAGTAALIWLLFKNGFDWYINNLTNMEVIFGVVSFIPIFLFWIYANWVIILSGVVLVAILDGRIEFNEVPSHPRQKIRIIIEKEIDRDNIEMITEFETNPQDLKKALNIFVDEEKK